MRATQTIRQAHLARIKRPGTLAATGGLPELWAAVLHNARYEPWVRRCVCVGCSYNHGMGLARSLEKRLERLVDGLSAAVFRGRMHPVDLANRLIRQADLMVTEESAGPTIPNRFSVAVNERDLDPSIDVGTLTAELNLALTDTAADRGWRIGGPIDVALAVDGSVGKGSIKCTATSQSAPLPPWGLLTEHRGDRHFELSDNRSVIGRSEDVDIRLDDAEVSRHHAVVFREGGRLWISDLGSANGTRVNGMPVDSEPLEIGSGDMLSFGPATFAVRMV